MLTRETYLGSRRTAAGPTATHSFIYPPQNTSTQPLPRSVLQARASNLHCESHCCLQSNVSPSVSYPATHTQPSWLPQSFPFLFSQRERALLSGFLKLESLRSFQTLPSFLPHKLNRSARPVHSAYLTSAKGTEPPSTLRPLPHPPRILDPQSLSPVQPPLRCLCTMAPTVLSACRVFFLISQYSTQTCWAQGGTNTRHCGFAPTFSAGSLP